MSHAKEDHPARSAPPLEVVPDHWYAVLEAKNLGKDPVQVRRLGEDLVLYRTASGAARCLVDRCPHRGVALSRGRVIGEEIACGYHAFRFRSDGVCTTVPCDGSDANIPSALRAQAFVAREAHGLIWVFWGAMQASLPPIPWIADIPSDLAFAVDASYVWPVPTFRAIESMFDYHHAPVLHGQRSLRFTPVPRLLRLDVIACEADDERIELRCVQREEGGPPDGPTLRGHTSFRMPGLSFLRVGSFGRTAVFDTPIDAGSTWRFVRTVSPIGHALGFGKLIAWLSWELDARFGTQFKEDLPMVVTQAHPAGELFSDVYVKADAGCAQYDRIRKKLLRAARAKAEAYPPPVRLRLGAPRAPATSLPVIGG
jgi:nitrite reductase/ring-hydroxylating ferredoxin subunit